MKVQKIVLRVCIMCSKCKISIMTVISKFEGVNSIAIDGEKSTVTVVGTVDVACMVKALRKAKRPAEVESVGEPDKKKEEKEGPKPLPAATRCDACSGVVVLYDSPLGCTIL